MRFKAFIDWLIILLLIENLVWFVLVYESTVPMTKKLECDGIKVHFFK